MNFEEEIPYMGMWADLRKNFLQEERPEDLEDLAKEHMLIEYFASIEDKYSNRFEELVERQMEREGIDEDLKAKNPLEWVGLVNNIRSQVREILTEEICS